VQTDQSVMQLQYETDKSVTDAKLTFNPTKQLQSPT